MYILHLFPNEKFTEDYVTKINMLFGTENHIFYIYNNSAQICNKMELHDKNVLWGEIYDDYSRLKELFVGAERVILHSLMFSNYKQLRGISKLVVSSKQPVIWAIWGADLYNHYKANHGSMNPKKILREYQRKKLIKKLYGVITSNDYHLLLKWYKTQAKQFIAMYTYKLIEVVPYNSKDHLVHIMVGHSATETCRHIEVFEKLQKYKDKIKIYCPLSYPNNQEYIQSVSARGEELFGENYVPMTKFMDYPEYVDFLNQIDIGVFNNNRQQGNGNITNLLYLGKKIYMASENSLLKTYRELGALIYDYSQIDSSDMLEPLTAEIAEKNHKVVVERYSDESFYKSWNRVFNE